MLQWCALFIAIITEVAGTTMLKFVGENVSVFNYGVLLFMVGLSYFFLAKAVTKIPLSVAYATWEGLGLIAVTGIGCLLFNEVMSMKKFAGIGAILVGIILLKYGISDAKKCGDLNE